MHCPKCHLIIPDDSESCQCGFELKKGNKVLYPKEELKALAPRRAVAFLIDYLFSITIYVLVLFAGDFDLKHQWIIFLTIIFNTTGFLIKDGLSGGQSIGKMIMGIKVIDVHTEERCSLLQSIERSFVLVAFPAAHPFLAIQIFTGVPRMGEIKSETRVVRAKNGRKSGT